MFPVSTAPIIRSTKNCNRTLQRGQVGTWPRWTEVAVPILWPVPEAAVTVFSTPDDGCGGHPKHVEWFCSTTVRCAAGICRVNLQDNKSGCILLHRVRFLLILNTPSTVSLQPTYNLRHILSLVLYQIWQSLSVTNLCKFLGYEPLVPVGKASLAQYATGRFRGDM